MLKERLKYVDFNDEEREEDFYFNLTAAEITEMELETVGGLSGMIQKIIDAKDIPTITKIFKTIILKAYGEKSDDGKRFMKSEEISNAFAQTQAYSDLFMKLASDADYATNFINGIIPKEVKELVEKEESKSKK